MFSVEAGSILSIEVGINLSNVDLKLSSYKSGKRFNSPINSLIAFSLSPVTYIGFNTDESSSLTSDLTSVQNSKPYSLGSAANFAWSSSDNVFNSSVNPLTLLKISTFEFISSCSIK